MMEQNKRTEIILGSHNLDKLSQKKILIFGLGGVGSYVVEALARCNIGLLAIVDYDIIDITNLNRQIYALHSTIGQKKIDVAKNRIKDINPTTIVETYDLFINDETIKTLDFSQYDYVIDAIDYVIGKILIIEKCQQHNIPVLSSLGTANRKDPKQLLITDLSKTYNCPLARKVRTELRKKGIDHLTVLFSTEDPISSSDQDVKLGSVPYVPSVGGLLIASKVIDDLTKM